MSAINNNSTSAEYAFINQVKQQREVLLKIGSLIRREYNNPPTDWNPNERTILLQLITAANRCIFEPHQITEQVVDQFVPAARSYASTEEHKFLIGVVNKLYMRQVRDPIAS